MKIKMKRKAIHVELRKESKKFDGWLKYEITIQNTDGTTEVVPAYGKDLQDALSRVVHDERVQKLESKVISKVPLTGWVLAWFLGLCILVMGIYTSIEHRYAGLWIVGTILSYTFMTLSISNWFSLRNRVKR